MRRGSELAPTLKTSSRGRSDRAERAEVRERRPQPMRPLGQLRVVGRGGEPDPQVGRRRFGGEVAAAGAHRDAVPSCGAGEVAVVHAGRQADPEVQPAGGQPGQRRAGELEQDGVGQHGVRIVHAPNTPEGVVDVDAMAALMRTHRPRLVSVTHVPTNSGLVSPVAEIGRLCRELDLLYLVDACQSVGQLVIDVEEIGCDLLTATCRKFLRGPRGSGFLYVSDRVLRAGHEPLFIDMHGARWTAPDAYEPAATAARFEEWEFPYATVLGSAAAVRYARDVGIEAIARRTPALAARLRDGLAPIPGVRVLDRGPDPAALVTFEIAGWQPQAFKAAMDGRGINSALSFREFAQFDFGDKDVDWCLRLSPHYYNTEDEVDRVADAVAELAGSPS